MKQQLAGEEQGREIAVLLVGAGIHLGVERMKGFLGRFGVPISVVSFEVFELDGGPQLLIREVVDEPAAPPPPRGRLSVEAIREGCGSSSSTAQGASASGTARAT